MKNRRVGLLVVLATFVLVFVVLFCGWKALTFYQVDEPVAAALNSIDGIESFEVKGSSNFKALEIKLGEISDFSDFYREITVALSAIYKTQAIINLTDNRDDQLTDLYKNLQFTIFEAIQTGEFDLMLTRAKEMKDETDVDDLDIDMDICNVYVTMKKDGRQLYEIIPRNDAEKNQTIQVYTPRNSAKLS